jgi:cysteinyl-tRNA synthetase
LAAFVERMDDDLDTPAALAGVFDLVRRANSAADAGDSTQALLLVTTVAVLCGALGLDLCLEPAVIDADVAALVRDRDAARDARDWAQADAIRAELAALGWVVEDGPHGTRLHRRPGLAQ